MSVQPQPGDALLVVDMQNDFHAGGSLSVPDAEAIIAPVNSYLELFARAGLPIYASRDYHPADHTSFVANGGQWPAHCVAGSNGAEFHPGMVLPPGTIIISKGCDSAREAYSAMDSTPLTDELKRQGVRQVFVCGLATDYCVFASARDLLAAGYQVVVLTDAIRGVDVQPGDSDRALAALAERGATLTTRDTP